MNKLKKKINFLTIIILLLVLVILIMIILFVRNSLNTPKCDEKEPVKKEISKNEELDNYEYIGIYNYEEDKECGNDMNLVLTSDYSAIFYVGDCHNKAYYYGKYRIVDNKINLYSLTLEDSTNDVEMKVEDDSIYFNLTEDNQYITSSYGRSESVRLKKMYNAV